MAKAVGIDLGTTNSVIAAMEGGEPTVIVNAEGSRTTPSVVAFTDTGERLVGQLARRQAILNPKGTIYSAKRFIGRHYDEVGDEIKAVGFDLVPGPEGMARFEVRGRQHAPEEISAQVLRKLAEDAARFLGERVTQAVVTVPAYFNDAQRTATKDAGRIAGLEVLRIINEPTAAALAYGLDKREHETVLVFDLGGGTFDVSVLDVGEGVVEVRATAGDTHLGGDDFDRRLVDHLAEEFKREQGIDLRNDPQALQRLFEAAEKAKVELSSVTQTQVSLPFITADAAGPKHLTASLMRSTFSLGLETLGGVMTRVIDRNTTIPARRAEVFSTAEDNQPAVDVVVLQGERERAGDNRVLGRFRLENIRPAPRGTPQVEVTFDIDANGILNVSARDRDTGAEQAISITESGNLDRSDVERMVAEGERNRAEDAAVRQLIEARNELDGAAYQVSRTLEELGDSAPAHERARADLLVADARQAVKEEAPLERMRSLTGELRQVHQGLRAAAGAAGGGEGPEPGPEPGPGERGGGRSGDDDVIDADFTKD